jgi:hypothetical protein
MSSYYQALANRAQAFEEERRMKERHRRASIDLETKMTEMAGDHAAAIGAARAMHETAAAGLAEAAEAAAAEVAEERASTVAAKLAHVAALSDIHCGYVSSKEKRANERREGDHTHNTLRCMMLWWAYDVF